ncbi:unnamed protein product [Mytilus coruscus]|uniref:Uncharacterized protein n=1 Tax=Mytilus coruscus TaxID=42192 RepID=A0A6J8E8F6_MYTCO|nr:unnamed protein product [Mytilus coruscus]
MGLLNDYSKKPINVKINETSGQCQVVIGNNSTTVGITHLLLGMVRNHVELDKKHDYENINLCYFSKFQWFVDSGWFELKKYFGIPFQEFGYKCCTLRNETVYCDDKLHRNEGYRLVPYAIAVMLVCFSPFFLLFVATCMDIDIESKLEDFACSRFQRNPNTNYVPIYFEHPILIGLFDDNGYRKKDIGVLGKCEFECCASCLSCFGEIYQTYCQPRIKRFVFVLISPMFIYLEWLVFYLLTWTNRIEELNKNEILFGFTSVLGGVKFNTFMYPTGPLFALVFYMILGISILVLPKDFENSVIIGDNTQYSAISNLLHVLSPSFIDGKGYKFLQKTLSTFTFLPCNPAYWLSVKEKPTTIVCRIIFIFIFLPFIILPILPFSILMLYGWMAYSFKKLKIENTFSKMKDKNVDMTQTGDQTNQQENESTQPLSESIQLEGTDTTNLCNNQNNSSENDIDKTDRKSTKINPLESCHYNDTRSRIFRRFLRYRWDAVHRRFIKGRQYNSDQDKEATRARKERNRVDTLAVLEYLSERDPFANDVSLKNLRNIEPGVEAEPDVNVDKAESIGNKTLELIKGEKFLSHSFKKSNQSITLAAKPKSKSGSDFLNTDIDPQFMFQRLATAANGLCENTSEVFQYELSSVPSSMFD